MKTNILCTRKQAAALLGLAPQTLAKWSMTGRNLAVVRLSNRAVRYSREEIENFIRKNTASSRRMNVNLQNEGETNE